ncbi:MAG: aldehyde dehydrogenase family protein, partial [Ktedonobacterales bacterium]
MVTADRPTATSLAPFVNTPLTDFTRAENIQAQEAALRQVESEIGATFPLIIAGEKRATSDTFASVNPARPKQEVARFAKATVQDVEDAVQAAWKTFQTWQYAPAAERAGYLFKAAEL